MDLKQLSSICPEVLKNAGVEADQLRDRFCSGKPSAIPSCSDLEHIFAPLFSAPVSVRISLLKLKVLEILIYLSNMKSEHKELTQYFSQQTELIKEIHQQLTEHLDQRFTIAELSKQYLINTSTLKEIFKAVYGQPIATYMKEFRVRQAMKLLRETNDTIADIASQVGYQTQGKFSSAFQSIVKMSPRESRKIQGIAPLDSFSKNTVMKNPELSFPVYHAFSPQKSMAKNKNVPGGLVRMFFQRFQSEFLRTEYPPA